MAAAPPTLSLLLGAMVVGASGAPAPTPVADAVAAELTPTEQRGLAISVVRGGLMVSWVVGILLGSITGDNYGWRTTFILVGGNTLLVVAALAIWKLLLVLENASPSTSLTESMYSASAQPSHHRECNGAGVATSFVVPTYVRPLPEDLTGLGNEGIGLFLLPFSLAAVTGTVLGGYAADRFANGKSAVPILVALAASLLSFSLLSAVGLGPPLAVLGAGAALMRWSVLDFTLISLQQYRLISVAPEDENEVLSLNASPPTWEQGFGSSLGPLTLNHVSISSSGRERYAQWRRWPWGCSAFPQETGRENGRCRTHGTAAASVDGRSRF